MSCTVENAPVVHAEDKYRIVDRNLKNYIKAKQQEVENKNKKRVWSATTSTSETTETLFDWSEVINIPSPSDSVSDSGTARLRYVKTLSHCCCPEPHDCCSSKEEEGGGGGGGTVIYEIENYPPGLFVFSKALCDNAQLLWARRALLDYSKAEHTNLSNLHRQQQLQQQQQTEVGGGRGGVHEEKQQQHHQQREEVEDLTNLWEESIKAKDNFTRFNKLRWSCLGYHYDWTKRMYQRNVKSLFPIELTEICRFIAQEVHADLIPEAAIVNYYPLGSCMGGHLDDAEHTLNHPIVSLSIGCASVFLMGGRTKDIHPNALLLRSGDAVVMSGESRHCYHGVPVILSEAVEERLTGETTRIHSYYDRHHDGIEEMDKIVLSYLRSHRINMNVRQVRVDVTDEASWVDKAGTGYVKYAP
eukprot:gene7562-8362_t